MNDGAEAAARALMETGRSLAQAGNAEAALAVLRQAHTVAPPGSSLQFAIEHLIERTAGRPAPAPGAPAFDAARAPGAYGAPPNPPFGFEAPMPKPAVGGEPTKVLLQDVGIPGFAAGWPPPAASMVQPVQPQVRAWKPQLPGPSRGRLLVSLLGVSVAVGLLLFLVARLFTDDLNRIADLLLIGGSLIFQPIRNGALAMVIGLVQVWRLRERLPAEGRLMFVLFALAGGIVGGLAGGLFGEASVRPTGAGVAAGIGAIIGGTAGTISAFLQSRLLPDFRRGSKWLIFNSASWGVIWAVGYVVGWMLGNSAGVAAASGFIVVLTGAALTAFLYLSPELEY